MKRMITLMCACALTFAGVCGRDNYNSIFIGQQAGDNSLNIDRTVFIGPAAGYEAGHYEYDEVMDYGFSITSNLFIGAAAGLQGAWLNSNVGMGYRAFRRATNCVNCVGIGTNVFADANGKTNEVNINNQLFISPNQFWIRLNPNSTAEEFYFDGGNIVFDGNVLSINGDILVRELRAHFDHDIKIGHPEYGHGISLRDVAQRLVVIEQMLEISRPNLMSAPNPNTPTNTPTSH